MEKYYYLYKNSAGIWNDAKNPVFIAKHTYCRAVPKEEIEQLGYDFIADFVYDLNEGSPDVKNISVQWEII
jgi:hypothetical protein